MMFVYIALTGIGLLLIVMIEQLAQITKILEKKK